MGRIGRAVGIDRIVGVAVIGDLHDLVPIATGISSGDDLVPMEGAPTE